MGPAFTAARNGDACPVHEPVQPAMPRTRPRSTLSPEYAHGRLREVRIRRRVALVQLHLHDHAVALVAGNPAPARHDAVLGCEHVQRAARRCRALSAADSRHGRTASSTGPPRASRGKADARCRSPRRRTGPAQASTARRADPWPKRARTLRRSRGTRARPRCGGRSSLRGRLRLPGAPPRGARAPARRT